MLTLTTTSWVRGSAPRTVALGGSSPAISALLARVHRYASALGERRADASVAPLRSEEASPVGHGMRLCGYFEKVAGLADISPGSPPRRAYDPRIEAVGIHLAAVHSMPLHRIVELVAHAIARRARNGAVSAGRGKRRAHRRGRSQQTVPERAQR